MSFDDIEYEHDVEFDVDTLAEYFTEKYDVDSVEIYNLLNELESNSDDELEYLDMDDLADAIADVVDVSVEEILDDLWNLKTAAEESDEYESDDIDFEQNDDDEDYDDAASFLDVYEESMKAIPKTTAYSEYLSLFESEDSKDKEDDKPMTNKECVEFLMSKKEFMPDENESNRKEKAESVCSVKDSKK